jgi:phage terminase large subunit
MVPTIALESSDGLTATVTLAGDNNAPTADAEPAKPDAAVPPLADLPNSTADGAGGGSPAVPVKRKSGRPLGTKNKPKPVKPVKPAEIPIEKKQLLLQYFPELFIGDKPYKWQFDVLEELNYRDTRVALKAANGSGKTDRVVARVIAWHMMRFPGSQTVVTAGVYRQVVDVLWPVMRNLINGLGGEAMGWKVTENKILYTAPHMEGQLPNEPAMCVGFSADKPESAEGWHVRGPSQNLLYIIDEAKAVPDGIFDAMERCQPTRVLEVSSPGGRAGRFFDRFAKADPRYKLFTVTAYDCPHIKKEWIDQQIAAYGIKSPVIQSMIFAEFGDEDQNSLVLPLAVLQRAISSPPQKSGTELRAGADFAAGGDENVIQVLEGNTPKERICWREKDTMAAVGRFITEFKRLGLKPENIWGDGSGIGIPMCDALREAGWPINRVNNGDAAWDDHKFANRGTEMWVSYARMVETGQMAVPKDDEILHRQLTTRRLEHNSRGKLIVERKEKMRERGLDSPDRADAMVLAACGGGQSFGAYASKYGKGVSLDDLDGYGDHEEEGAALGGCHAG